MFLKEQEDAMTGEHGGKCFVLFHSYTQGRRQMRQDTFVVVVIMRPEGIVSAVSQKRVSGANQCNTESTQQGKACL